MQPNQPECNSRSESQVDLHSDNKMSKISVSKPLKIDANLGVDENKINNNIASSSGATSELPFPQDDVDTFIDVFTEDILPEILDNQLILTAKDLLNFRLVNRCWRDAATSVLLKRNMCTIALDCHEIIFDKEGNPVSHVKRIMGAVGNENPCFSRFCNFHQPLSFVADLSQLIASSPKFPSTSIRLNTQGSSGHETVKYDITTCNDSHDQDEYCPQKDLLHFFSIYGKKIKELLLESEISEKSIQDLLYVHMPHLICLNMSYFCYIWNGRGAAWAASENPVCLRAPSKLELQEIIWIWGRSAPVTYNFLKNIIQVSPNLKCIKNVDPGSLGVLLELGKCHLAHDLSFAPEVDQISTILQLAKLLADEIWKKTLPSFKLSKLTATLYFQNPEYNSVVKVLNVILSATKNSLRFLNLKIHQSCPANIIIPPLPRLECLHLFSWKSTESLVQIHFSDVIRSVIEARGVTGHEPVYDSKAIKLPNNENEKIPSHFFPRLREVNFDLKKMEDNPRKLMDFFLLEHLGGSDKVTKIPGDTLPTVTTLTWNNFPLYGNHMSTLFPNVTDLKIRLKSPERLQNSVWTTFPKLRKFEISIARHTMLDMSVVDSFFTGFSQELCEKLKQNLASTELDVDHAQGFKRTEPYIGDCKNLKELKINVGRGSWKIASKVTSVFGFQTVIHRAKIIFSFEDLYKRLNAEEIEDYKSEELMDNILGNSISSAHTVLGFEESDNINIEINIFGHAG